MINTTYRTGAALSIMRIETCDGISSERVIAYAETLDECRMIANALNATQSMRDQVIA